MSEPITFINGFLIDGAGAEPVPGAVVIVEDEVIKEVGPAGTRPPSPGRVIDLQGRTLMPGLIDAHVHPGALALSLERQLALPPAVYVLRTVRNLETDLALGFTTLREACTLDQSFKEAVNQGLIRGPRLFLAVSQLVQSGAEDYQPGFIPQEAPPQNSLGLRAQVCDGPDEVRRGARRALGLGADQIKVFASGEVISQSHSDRTTPDQWKFTVEELRAAVETAEACGTYVMAHAYGPRAIKNCVAAGVRSLEHGNLMDREAAEMMAEQGTYYVPTLSAYHVLARENRGELTPFMREKLAMVEHKAFEALEMAYRAGVKIASGSDVVGPNQHLKGRELVLKAEVMSPLEAIVSATRTNAELINMSDRLGTVEPGKLADLIVVDGNPLADLSLFENGLERVVLVMKQGAIVKNLM
ncbi:MAG: amidohydrolase family protein [Thermodesulfobacteriota bacterium]